MMVSQCAGGCAPCQQRMVECYRACEQDSDAFSLQRCLIYSYSYDFARLGLSISSPIFTGPHAPFSGRAAQE